MYIASIIVMIYPNICVGEDHNTIVSSVGIDLRLIGWENVSRNLMVLSRYPFKRIAEKSARVICLFPKECVAVWKNKNVYRVPISVWFQYVITPPFVEYEFMLESVSLLTYLRSSRFERISFIYDSMLRNG